MKRFVALLGVLVVLAGGAYVLALATYHGAGPQQGHATTIVIKPGIGLRGIARDLQAAGVVRDGDVFAILARLTGRTQLLKAGEYAIADGASMADIVDQLAAGRAIVHKVTVAEGLTSKMAFDIVKDKDDLIGEPGEVPQEGAVLPETYLYERGTTRADILARMQADQKEFLDREWDRRDAGLPLKSKREAVILASVVEKETAKADERRRIAAVFYNRLKTGMRLQSDPTIIYGLTKGYPLGRGILKSEIEAKTPYNTYAVTGLPAGPICNPGKDSILAVLHPEKNDYLYFVADGSGGHAFASTLDQQINNIHRWRRIEKMQKSPAPKR